MLKKCEKIEYVRRAIIDGNYTILPSDVANGTVYKVWLSGNLQEEGIERGFLYIPAGSGIRLHSHQNDIEIYQLIMGQLCMDEEPLSINICGLNNCHSIKPVKEDTIIETCKINEIFLGEQIASYCAKFSYLNKGR